MTITQGHKVHLNRKNDALNPATIVLSVVVVTWNNVRLVKECLGSLASVQAIRGVEIIVVDNGSSDGTADLIQKELPQYRLIRNDTNVGFATANNIGIRVSRGKYVCLINSDVVVTQDCVEKLLEYMEDHTDIGVLGPKMLLRDGSVGRSCLHFPSVASWMWRALALDTIFERSERVGAYLMTYFRYDRITDVDILTGWFWIIRRDAISRVGLLDERFFMYGEDMDWCKRFKQSGWRVVFYPEAAAVHHCGASSSSTPIHLYVEKMRAGLWYCRRYHRKLAFAGFWFAAWLHQFTRIIGYGVIFVIRPQTTMAFKIRRSWACLRWLMNICD